ncbi:hypothetical protein [Prosthecobacter fluviatilis]|uniref:DUF4393 domain-containing protein n=1 Tax=Prosthecobacter fluviatilis TaxID=445931 RepID=A0ABW0KXS3_9BACT
MSAISPEVRKEVFKVLGIKDEQQLQLVAQVAKDAAVTSEEILGKVPSQMLIIAHLVEASNYMVLMKREIPLPLSDELIEAIHQIYRDEIGSLTSLPAFYEARKNLRQLIEADGKNDSDAVVSVGEVSFTPFLMGKKPPYLPVVKVTINNDQNRALWSDMLHWPDMMFVSRALLEQVSEHVKDSQELQEKGMLVQMDQARIKGTLDKFRSIVDRLEKTLLKPEM